MLYEVITHVERGDFIQLIGRVSEGRIGACRYAVHAGKAVLIGVGEAVGADEMIAVHSYNFV